MFSVEVKKPNTDYIQEIITGIESLKNKTVAAGFPKGKLNAPHYEFKTGISKEKNKNPPSIIDVAIKNNYGIGVPRRDFMRPAIKKWEKFIGGAFESFGKELEQGKFDVNKFLKLLGEMGADFISQSIIDLRTPPNSPVTIKLKGSSNPLVDTGDMARAVRWEIREKGNTIKEGGLKNKPNIGSKHRGDSK